MKKKIDEAKLLADLKAGTFRSQGSEAVSHYTKMFQEARKDATLNTRVNRQDLEGFKEKALAKGIKYQTAIGYLLNHVANGRIALPISNAAHPRAPKPLRKFRTASKAKTPR